jgi:hypothetical protein
LKVYFILDSVSNAVKIGKANNIQERISDLQTGNPNPLMLIHYIDCESENQSLLLEQTLHKRYKHLRKSGEWFTYDVETFSQLFDGELNFERKSPRNPISYETIFGTEHFGIEMFPCCFFYPNLTAQIMTNYEDAMRRGRRGNPFRTMRYPTDGKPMLLPWSHEVDKVFISDRKHRENMKLKKLLKTEKIEINDSDSLEKFLNP